MSHVDLHEAEACLTLTWGIGLGSANKLQAKSDHMARSGKFAKDNTILFSTTLWTKGDIYYRLLCNIYRKAIKTSPKISDLFSIQVLQHC